MNDKKHAYYHCMHFVRTVHPQVLTVHLLLTPVQVLTVHLVLNPVQVFTVHLVLNPVQVLTVHLQSAHSALDAKPSPGALSALAKCTQ